MGGVKANACIAVYLDWDFDEYCRDIDRLHVGQGRNKKKESLLQDRWPGMYTSAVHINNPRAIADTKGRIVAWILPGILHPALQVFI